MAKYHQNNVGSLVLDRHCGNLKLWAFRRKLFNTIGCGVSRQQEEDEEERSSLAEEESQSKKLSEILKHSEVGVGVEMGETKRKIEVLEELQGVVKRLQLEEKGSKQMEAALDVRRLAKDDSDARETLAMLGAIPPLVGMLDLNHHHVDYQISSLYALLNLAIGNDMNKAAIVKAGAIHKMLHLIDSPNSECISSVIVANFLALSALDSNKPIIATSGAIPFLVKALDDINSQTKQDSLRAIYNLSILPSNISILLETNLIHILLNALGNMEVSEWILSILSNMVSTAQGRKAISNFPDAFPILIDALNWTDSPGCQEKASYILMVVAHKASYGDRQAMVEAGVTSALLELTLIGSSLAQKRASRILECLRVDKGKQVGESMGLVGMGGGGGPLSAPICGGPFSSAQDQEDEEEMTMMSEERRAVKQLVQQSLQNNMTRMVKRANLPQDFVPSEHFKSLVATATSTSKSLPF